MSRYFPRDKVPQSHNSVWFWYHTWFQQNTDNSKSLLTKDQKNLWNIAVKFWVFRIYSRNFLFFIIKFCFDLNFSNFFLRPFKFWLIIQLQTQNSNNNDNFRQTFFLKFFFQILIFKKSNQTSQNGQSYSGRRDPASGERRQEQPPCQVLVEDGQRGHHLCHLVHQTFFNLNSKHNNYPLTPVFVMIRYYRHKKWDPPKGHLKTVSK